jgi:hypothetical protein
LKSGCCPHYTGEGGGGGLEGGEGEKTGVTGKWRRMGGTYHIVKEF